MNEIEKEFIENDFAVAVLDALEADQQTLQGRHLSFKDLAPE
jgi:hypothetical protein